MYRREVSEVSVVDEVNEYVFSINYLNKTTYEPESRPMSISIWRTLLMRNEKKRYRIL